MRRPRSQNDYLELANRFHAVILSGVPRMGPRQASEARRFTWLIDVFYDHRVKLIMSAECEPEEIYTEGALANEFHRTVSRILEMQSREYLESERRLTVTLAGPPRRQGAGGWQNRRPHGRLFVSHIVVRIVIIYNFYPLERRIPAWSRASPMARPAPYPT